MLGYYRTIDIPGFTVIDPTADYEFDHIELAAQYATKFSTAIAD
jgi:hypothetical protein